MTTRTDVDYALSIAIESIRKAGETLNEYLGSNMKIKRKTGYDIVSEADLVAEKQIIDHLREYFPNHHFISEEIKSGWKGTHRFQWVIDPLDGTINYVSGLPLFSSSVALQEEGRTILGVIYDVLADELYTSIKGEGSFLNRKKIQVSDNSELGTSVLSFMLTSHYSEKEVAEVLKHISNVATVCRGLRLYVSQALELAYIARGKLDGTLCIKSRGFSAAAGALILRESGGRVTDFNGREFDNSSRSLLATNSLLHDKVLRIITKVERTKSEVKSESTRMFKI